MITEIPKNKVLQYALSMLSPDLNHVLEFGVYKGTSIGIMRQLLPSQKQIFGFDSFEGLPEDWCDASGSVIAPKKRFDTGKNIPDIKGVKFYDGWFNETIPQYIPEAKPIALLHVDCDLYSSTKEVLYSLNSYIVAGTIIVFDEWFYDHNVENTDHEQKCFYEWVVDTNRTYELIDSPYPRPKFEQQIVKIHA